ncbi:hypothetical protein Tco_0932761 [Tanacetum coccineum]
MKRGFSGEHVPLFDTMLLHDQPGQGEGPTLTVESQHTPIASPTTSQPTTSQPMSSQEQPSQVPTTEPITTASSPLLNETIIPQTTSSMPYDSPLLGVTRLEKDLKQTKKVYGNALTKLVKKVKHLEDKLKYTTKRRKARMVIFDVDNDLVSEDPSKQGRMSKTEYEEVDVAKILADASRERVKTYKSYTRRRSTDNSRDSTARGIFSTAKEILSTDERIAQKINEEEMAKAVAREKREKINFEKALELQKQLDETDNIDWNIVAEQVQERQSDTIKRYKMGYFKGMSYDVIRPIFEEEYNKVQTLFKKDTEVEKTKTKRIAEETLLQESFKKLRTAEASSSKPIQEQPTEEPKELSEEELKKMLEIVPVEEIKAEALQVMVRNITEAYQVFEDMLKGFDREDLVTLWSLVKERFRLAEPTKDMERAL